MVRITATYEGELHCEAVHGPSKATLTTDAPVDNHGRGASFSPTDLVATGLGTCVATIMGIKAEALDVDLEGMEIEIEKHMTGNPRRIDQLVVDVHLPRAYDPATRRRLEQAGHGCPVQESLHPDVSVEIRLHDPTS